MEKDIILLCDSFFPENNSAAVQLFDLAQGLARRGLRVFVFCPRHKEVTEQPIDSKGLTVFRVRCLNPKRCKNYVSRLIAEISLPIFYIFYYLRVKKDISENFKLVVYSPSIFLFLFKLILPKKNISSYLILRDLFPYWAREAGIINNDFVFGVLSYVARIQIASFDMVGCQSDKDVEFVQTINSAAVRFNNWVTAPARAKNMDLPLKLQRFFEVNSGRVVVYTGNVGPAQDIARLLDLSELYIGMDVGFLFLGSGSLFKELADYANTKSLPNVLFHESLPNRMLPQIFDKCSVGVVSLNKKINVNNVPGKFISYLSNGLPVLCDSAFNAELEKYFSSYEIGAFVSSKSLLELKLGLDRILLDNHFESFECYEDNFSTDQAVDSIMGTVI